MYAHELDKKVIESVLDLLHSQLEHMLNFHLMNLSSEEEKNKGIDRCLNEDEEDFDSFREMEIKFDKQTDNCENTTKTDSNIEMQNLERILGDFLVLIRRITSNKIVRLWKVLLQNENKRKSTHNGYCCF